jgi:hypothetical protein
MSQSAAAVKTPERDAATVRAARHPAPAHGPSMLLQRKCACGAAAGSAGQCGSCAEQAAPLQRRAAHDGGGAAAIPESVAATVARPGQPLDHDTRGFMESRFGADFGGVQVHDDSAAAQSARDVDAHAYTVGQHVVFDHGQYQPHSEAGRQLLAHELAHTLQQQGLQRAGIGSLEDHGPEYRRLEHEADRMSEAAMGGAPLPAWRGAGRPTLSRAPRKPEEGGLADLTVKKSKQKLVVTSSYMSTAHEVTPESAFERGGKSAARLESFTVNKLFVPGTKGPNALAIYQSMAKAGGLQATLNVDGTTKAALWQERADTSSLQGRWLKGVGWPGGKQADALWEAAGGDKVFPQVGGKTCQMDHIVELQIGGNNTEQNIQALDGEQNRDSGGAIKNQVFMLAAQIVENTKLSSGEVEQVTLRFQDAELKGAPETLPKSCPPAKKQASCLSVEGCARQGGGAAPADPAKAVELVEFPLSAGGADTNIKVDKGFEKDKKARAPILDDPLNKSAAELIPGLLLNDLYHRSAAAKGVNAEPDTREKTRLPITLEGKKSAVQLSVEKDGKLKLLQENAALKFNYKYLSPGVITKFHIAEGGDLQWQGYITPRLRFLGRLDVAYDKGELKITKGLDPKNIKSPFPGAKLTEASLSMILAPEFKPAGTLAFEFGSARKLASAKVEASADDSGLVLTGELEVFLPGVDKATGKVKFRDGEWSGAVLVSASAMQSKLKFVKSGEVSVGFAGGKLDAAGKVQLALPGENEAELALGYRNDKYLFTGHGEFKVNSPYLKPIRASLLYDGELFRAKGMAAFAFKGLEGSIDATYDNKNGDEKVYGKGEIKISKKDGKINGSMAVELHPSQKISGKGKLSYEIKKGLVASAGITIDDQQKITFEGELVFPDIQLFKRFPEVTAKNSIFTASLSIPVPGLSFGPLGGVKVKVYGGLDYWYYAGPGVLKNVRAMAKFSPFEADPDFSFKLNATASIPAGGGISGKIGADLVIDIGIAEAGGGLNVEAGAELQGKAELASEINYAKDRFSIDASAYIGGKVILSAGLNAHVYAEAGVWRFKVRTDKYWELGKAQFDTGLSLGVRLPLHYDSQDGFRMPSLSDIKPEPATLDLSPSRLLDKLFTEAPSREKES